MIGGPPSERRSGASSTSESVEEGESTFLAEVARIPEPTYDPAVDSAPQPGAEIGRFLLRERLGQGGMGVVYAAEDRTLGRTVALKLLPITNEEEPRRRFLREARSAAALNHPAIATVYDVVEVEGRVFIAMELIRGRTLRARLLEQGGPL